jgi:hypothetical protein
MKKLHRWQTATISEAATIGGGSGFPETYQDNSAGDFPFIKVSDLNLPGNEKHVVIANNWITEDVRKKIRAKVQPSGAIVFAKVRGALLTNKRRILTRPAIIDNNMMSLMATDTYPEYLYQVMFSIDLGRYRQEGAVPSVNGSRVMTPSGGDEVLKMIRLPLDSGTDASHALRDQELGLVHLLMVRKKLKSEIIAAISTAMSLLLVSCDIAGPAYPEKNGREYLENQGYVDDLISRLIDGLKLEPAEVEDLQASRSSDVRFLVARNPSLTHLQIDVSISSKDDFTRSGAANNTNLSARQIERLTEDPSHTVYSALAGNTALSEEELIRLREKRNLGGLWFAMNPNCPESIRQSILASGDTLAKDWLKIIDGRKKDGHYVQNSSGRWSKR